MIHVSCRFSEEYDGTFPLGQGSWARVSFSAAGEPANHRLENEEEKGLEVQDVLRAQEEREVPVWIKEIESDLRISFIEVC